MAITRRTFLKGAAVSGITAAAIITGTRKAVAGVAAQGQYATVIDLTKCNGCSPLDTPYVLQPVVSRTRIITRSRRSRAVFWAAQIHNLFTVILLLSIIVHLAAFI